MNGVAVTTNARNRHQAFAATWRGTGARRGDSSRTRDDWRPGIIALAPRPAAIVAAATTPNAAIATGTPANGASAAMTTADAAEQGVSVTRNEARTRSRRVRSTRVP